MWEVLLYMCCFYWLIRKLLLANGLTEYSQAGRDIYREKVGRVREQPCSCLQETDHEPAETLPLGHDLLVMHRLMEMGHFKI